MKALTTFFLFHFHYFFKIGNDFGYLNDEINNDHTLNIDTYSSNVASTHYYYYFKNAKNSTIINFIYP